MKPSSLRSGEEGFSLLGVLVALVITAMTGLLIAQSFTLTDRLMLRQDTYESVTSREIDALATLRRLIGEAEPPFPGREETAFDGGANELSFMLRPGILAGGEAVRVGVLLDKTTDALVMRMQGKDGEKQADRIVLLPDVSDLTFDYYRADANGRAAASESWRDRRRLPDLIVARIGLGKNGREIEVSVEMQRKYSTACLIFGWADCLKADQ